MLLSLIAAHPQAPAGLLTHLAEHLCTRRDDDQRSGQLLAHALAANPRTPPEALVGVLARWPRVLLTVLDPAGPPETNLTRAATLNATAELRTALAAGPGTAANLTLYAAASAHGTTLPRVLCTSVGTPPALRTAAARALAVASRVSAPDLRAVLAAVAREPGMLPALVEAGTDVHLLRALAVASARIATDVHTTASSAWYLTAAATPAAIASHLAAHPGASNWCGALSGPDPAGVTAAGALIAHPRSSGVLSGILTSRTASPATIQGALLAMAAVLPSLNTAARTVAVRHLAHGPVSFVQAFAPVALHSIDGLLALLRRDDLPPQVLDSVTARIPAYRGAGPSDIGPGMYIMWGAALATSAHTTTAQRSAGRMLVLNHTPEPEPIGMFDPFHTRACTRARQAHVLIDTFDHARASTLAAGGASLPLALLRAENLRELPAVAAMTTAILDGELAHLDSPAHWFTLTTLAPELNGTLGELLSTIRGISS